MARFCLAPSPARAAGFFSFHSPVILKREALKAFQCASTVKAVMTNTGMMAGEAFVETLETGRRWTFTASLKSRFAQHDIKNENGNAITACFLWKIRTLAAYETAVAKHGKSISVRQHGKSQSPEAYRNAGRSSPCRDSDICQEMLRRFAPQHDNEGGNAPRTGLARSVCEVSPSLA